jgi:hypothetical protein
MLDKAFKRMLKYFQSRGIVMNNKGFAISGILYSILIIFVASIAIMLYNLQNKKTVLDQIKLDAVEAVNLETKVDYITEKYNKCEEELNSISTNAYLRYDEETSYIQALDTEGNWENVYYTDVLPILSDPISLVPIMESSSSEYAGYIFGNSSSDGWKAFDNSSATYSYGRTLSTAGTNSIYSTYGYLGYDFQNPVDIKYIKVALVVPSGYNGMNATRPSFLQYSDDKTTWYNASESTNVAFNDTTPTIITNTLEEDKHRYWRFYGMTNAYSCGAICWPDMFIATLEFYGYK